LIRFQIPALPVAALLLLAFVPALRAQAPANPPATPGSIEGNRKALKALFEDYWQDKLKHDPELASTLGDNRYNDQIADYTVKAVNDALAREENFLMQLAAIDPAGLTDEEKTSRDLLLRHFADDQEAASFKEWEMPLNQMGGLHTTYPELVAELSFTTVKDYDDWIARLHAMPKAFDQVTTNMSIGKDDHRVPPKYLLQKALDQIKELAGIDQARRTRAHQGRDAGGNRQRGAAGLPALCALR